MQSEEVETSHASIYIQSSRLKPPPRTWDYWLIWTAITSDTNQQSFHSPSLFLPILTKNTHTHTHFSTWNGVRRQQLTCASGDTEMHSGRGYVLSTKGQILYFKMLSVCTDKYFPGQQTPSSITLVQTAIQGNCNYCNHNSENISFLARVEFAWWTEPTERVYVRGWKTWRRANGTIYRGTTIKLLVRVLRKRNVFGGRKVAIPSSHVSSRSIMRAWTVKTFSLEKTTVSFKGIYNSGLRLPKGTSTLYSLLSAAEAED